MLKVWGRATSSNVQKVMWCIDELGLERERVDLGGPFGGNRDPAYLALNPNGLVPTIDDDDFVLWESNAITRYLAAKHSMGGLMPADPAARADAERWMDWQMGSVAHPHFQVFFNKVRAKPGERDDAAIAAGRAKQIELYGFVEARLADRASLMGDRLTIADIPLGIMAYRWFSLVDDRPAMPRFEAWYQRLTDRPAFRANVMLPLS
jgi:glutathione S-transferase